MWKDFRGIAVMGCKVEIIHLSAAVKRSDKYGF